MKKGGRGIERSSAMKKSKVEVCPECGNEVKRMDSQTDPSCPSGWAYLACANCKWRGPVPRESLPCEIRLFGVGGCHDHVGDFGHCH